MKCCDYGCNQGANCLIQKPTITYKPNSEYVGRESNDSPPLGYFEDFCEFAITTLMPFTLGLMLGSVFVVCFIFGFFAGL